ncbi:hypothetical protein SLOPH_1067 [Spraguea lophii 42_110]|uniref:Uncharacterized protein n=1 Tax=Spraguea lophii (strain 42_110) TaxID=1358809 RepID=S7W749_SPRLO|nr:hypothetical protein SLOPH_1067 [Spraguea lophii 42_110]
MKTEELLNLYDILAKRYNITKGIYIEGFEAEQILVQLSELNGMVLEQAERNLKSLSISKKSTKIKKEKSYEDMNAKELLKILDDSCTDEESIDEEEVHSDYLIDQKN